MNQKINPQNFELNKSVMTNDNFEVFEITQLILNPFCEEEIISIGNDGCVRAWNVESLEKVR